jgi:hypothetical protein
MFKHSLEDLAEYQALLDENENSIDILECTEDAFTTL